ncbi:hypothetical protein GTA08_BOTSDO08390 [Neofusicoccum parvum]|nr:hypothetical protein GTA08_BOTSDO08390 [Neofusicoccum parvum]
MPPRLPPRLLPFRPAAHAPSRALSSRSARARRHSRPPTARSTPNPPTTDPSLAAAAAAASAPPPSPRRSTGLLDPVDPLNLKGTRAEEPTIRFFEQEVARGAAGGMSAAAPRPVSAARIEADARAAAALRVKIATLEDEVARLERDDELDPVVLRLRAIAAGRGDAEVEMLADAEPERVRGELEGLRVSMPPGAGGAAVYLERLNNCLRHAYLATDPSARPVIRQELWKTYKRAKMHLPGLLEQIPDPAWDMLFYSQAVRWKSNSRREEHMRELLADMKSVGMDGPPTRVPDEKSLDDVD